MERTGGGGEFLSSFGPAGAPDKKNWECPDLFPLKIEGEEEQRWVLAVDMGSAAVAGGSGGEYFVGHFDGRTFQSESGLDEAQWVDYGPDFYASQSWNLPSQMDRRIWLAWMNNWDYAQDIPTSPWRGAMTVPRELSLKRVDDQFRLIQKPVKELSALRGKGVRLEGGFGQVQQQLTNQSLGRAVEIQADFILQGEGEVELEVLAGPAEKTVVGYDTRSQRVYLDRRHSGVTDFYPGFAARYEAPLARRTDLKLHILVDHSSVEVFAADGEVVLTALVFPASVSESVRLNAAGVEGNVTLQLWPLSTIWSTP